MRKRFPYSLLVGVVLVASAGPPSLAQTRAPVPPPSAPPLRFRASAGILEAEVFDSLSATSGRRERWTREVVVVPPERPAIGEYVYVEELPEAIVRPAPIYPQGTQAEGTVMIQALVGTDGLVKDTKVVKSIPELDAAAVAAVMQWRFKPALTKGNPVAVWVAVPVKFSRP